jgi:hypothetical protein
VTTSASSIQEAHEEDLTVLDDIRNTDTAEYSETLRQRWGALLSYRYIGRQFSSMNNVSDDTVTLRHDMRNAAGGILAQIFSICAPGGGGPSDLEVVPNPVIHSLQILDHGNDVQRIEVIKGETLKLGTRMYYGRAVIVDADAHDRVLALIEGQGASIGDVPPGLQKFDDDPIEHIEDSPDLPPIWQVFGGSKRDDGRWTLPELRVEFASPDAALHVGPQFVIHETAALDLAAELAGTDQLQPEADHFMFLARGKVGPFRVEGEAARGADASGPIGVRLILHDEGNGDRAVSAASMTFRPVG